MILCIFQPKYAVITAKMTARTPKTTLVITSDHKEGLDALDKGGRYGRLVFEASRLGEVVHTREKDVVGDMLCAERDRS